MTCIEKVVSIRPGGKSDGEWIVMGTSEKLKCVQTQYTSKNERREFNLVVLWRFCEGAMEGSAEKKQGACMVAAS